MASKSSKPTRQNVKVVARIRPTNQKEISMGGVTCVKHTESNIEVTVDGNPNKFNLDRIFGPESTQIEVFEETAVPLIQDVLAGYNATIFAYGQTGTGKTHTMEGDITNENDKGIIPRAVDALFEGVSQADENIEFTFKVTYVEIYLERIRDLMDEHHLKNNLAVREDKIKGVYIAGVTEVYVASADELLQVMHVGATNRAVAATGMNEGSSRSHSVFTITVSQRDINTNAAKSGKLVLVDLAGSEMVRKTNASGQQLEEAKMINKSLSCLGQVINALTDGKSTHVPYRDSKLTRVLQDSLGGNSKTVLIVAVSPSSFNAPETVSTLRFGTRAKSIENKVTVNQTRSVEELEALLVRAEKAIDAQTAHIIALTTQLQHMQETGVVQPIASMTDSNGQINEQQIALEGKIVIDAAQYENEARALRQLQESVVNLSQELEDEKQDSQRKDGEMTQMSALLKEKERLIQEAITMVDEVKRSNDSLRERSEQLLQEKIEAVGELQSMKSSQDEAVSKIKYDMMELEVRLNTLEAENHQLRDEIAEMGGDSTNVASGKSNNNKNIISTASASEDEEAAMIRRIQNARRSYGGGIGGDSVDESGSSLSKIERKQLLESFSEQFAAICLKYKLDEPTSAELFAVLDSYAEAQERAFSSAEEKYIFDQKSDKKRVKDLEDQRSRLEKDLQGRIENVRQISFSCLSCACFHPMVSLFQMTQLQMKFDSLSRMDSKHVGESIQEREMSKQRSLQQRLEQLVAVHRQLLRKFATLELETSELKKKTMLRDERIKQLEGNSRTLVANIRQQAERHVAELASVKESIQMLKNEYDHRLEELKRMSEESNLTSPTGKGNIKVVVKPKALRGGGGGTNRSFYNESPRVMANMMEGGNPESSYFFPPTGNVPPSPGGNRSGSNGLPPPYPGPPPPIITDQHMSSSGSASTPSTFSRLLGGLRK